MKADVTYRIFVFLDDKIQVGTDHFESFEHYTLLLIANSFNHCKVFCKYVFEYLDRIDDVSFRFFHIDFFILEFFLQKRCERINLFEISLMNYVASLHAGRRQGE